MRWGWAQPRWHDAGGQDSPVAYGSSLQPAGKEKHVGQALKSKPGYLVEEPSENSCKGKICRAPPAVCSQGPGEELGAAGQGLLPPEQTSGINAGLASPSPRGGGAGDKATNSATAFIWNDGHPPVQTSQQRPGTRCHWRKSKGSIKAFNEGRGQLKLKEPFQQAHVFDVWLRIICDVGARYDWVRLAEFGVKP